MTRSIIPILFVFICQVSFAQEQPKDEPVPDMPPASTILKEQTKIYERVEIEPRFGNNSTELESWLKENIAQVRAANKKLPSGLVKIKVVVEKDGALTTPVFLEKTKSKLREATLNLLRSMPPWRPAVQNGRPVRAYTILTLDW